MANVPWIKITTDIFDDEKMALIDGMPDRDCILVIWFKLLCMAGRLNNSGVFMLNEKIAYTDEMLATIFRRPITTVRMALNTFKQFGMISCENGVYALPNWEKHQSLDKLESAKEKNRQRVAAYREKQKLIAQCNAYSNVTGNDDVTPCNAVDKDKEEDKDLDIKEINKEKIDFKEIVDLFHSICKSFSSVRSITEARKKALRARLNTYTLDDFRTLFEKAEASSFLKGSNDRNWTATFDWLIKDANMAKVLEGNYDDKPKRYTRKETKPNWMQPSMEFGTAEMDAVKKILADPVDDTANDPEFAAQAEQLKQRMQEKYGRKSV